MSGRTNVAGGTAPVSGPAELRFVVPGDPVPKGRPRSTVVRNRNGEVVHDRRGQPKIRVYTPGKTSSYEDAVRLHAFAAVRRARWTFAKGDTFELEVLATCSMSHEERRFDFDNVGKSVADAMNKVAYVDDKWIVRGTVEFLLENPRHPQVEIILRKRARSA